jgi:hypothetical protein
MILRLWIDKNFNRFPLAERVKRSSDISLTKEVFLAIIVKNL